MICGCNHCNGEKEDYGFFLIKFAQGKYAKDMYENEYLYFSNLNRFRNGPRTLDGRNDPREGNMEMWKNRKVELKLKDRVIAHSGSGNLELFDSSFKNKCCSLYKWTYDEHLNLSHFDERIRYKGSKAIVIHDWMKFLEVFDERFELKVNSRHSIKYYDPDTYEGKLSLFCKDDYFQFENEYRIIYHSLFKGPLRLKIPGLKKMAFLIDTTELVENRVHMSIAQ
ncbi:MAG: hypothetical protein P8M34_07840 [Saprospiraceae bacterium]|nr:hypothetical protein [Saprospiraceae bacterium]